MGGTRYELANNYDEAFAQYRPGKILFLRMFEEGYLRGVTRYNLGTKELHYKQLWGATYQDNIDTYTVGRNQLVGGFLKAGVMLKSVFDGSLWKRLSNVPAGPVADSCPSDESSLSPTFPVAVPAVVEHPSSERQKRVHEHARERIDP